MIFLGTRQKSWATIAANSEVQLLPSVTLDEIRAYPGGLGAFDEFGKPLTIRANGDLVTLGTKSTSSMVAKMRLSEIKHSQLTLGIVANPSPGVSGLDKITENDYTEPLFHLQLKA